MIKFTDEDGKIVTNLYQGKDNVIKEISYNKRNYIIKETNDGKIELAVYDKPFIVPLVQDMTTSTDDLIAFETAVTSRKWKNVDGVAVRLKENATLSSLIDTYKRGTKRAIKTFYDYALTNYWEYFITLTFRDSDVRHSTKLMSDTWLRFSRSLKTRNPNFKAIATFEEFEKGGYHIHAMLSDVDLNLVPARNNDVKSKNYKKFMYSEFGPQLFNSTDWAFGYNTVTCLDPNSIQAQLVNYMSKYMTKDTPASYGSRRFYRTQNLSARDTIVGYARENTDINNIIDKFNLKACKVDKAGNKYFRNY